MGGTSLRYSGGLPDALIEVIVGDQKLLVSRSQFLDMFRPSGSYCDVALQGPGTGGGGNATDYGLREMAASNESEIARTFRGNSHGLVNGLQCWCSDVEYVFYRQ